MASVSEVREKLDALLANQISLDQFEDWFLPYSWNIHKHGTHEVQRFVYAIEHALSEFDEDSDALRTELANAVRPFCASLEIHLGSIEVRPRGGPISVTGSAAIEIFHQVIGDAFADVPAEVKWVSSQGVEPIRMPIQHAEQWDPLWDTDSATRSLAQVEALA